MTLQYEWFSFSQFQTRVLKNDFARYNMDEEDSEELDQDDNGWKIIHTDVFRFPPVKSLFCAILGEYNAMYIIIIAFFIVILTFCDMLSYA